MLRNSRLIAAMCLTGAVVIWGMLDTPGLASFAGEAVSKLFRSRGWFVMLTATTLLITCGVLAVGRTGSIRLGRDEDRPEFSTFSWLTMMFAAGMGVGLLFYGVAEPVRHFLFFRNFEIPQEAAAQAMVMTIFHWGLHAWAIYGLVGLVIAYFGFRLGTRQMLSAPIVHVFGHRPWARPLGWLVDVLTIYAIAIGLAGSFAMGVFQAQSGLVRLLGIEDPGLTLSLAIFAALCVAYFLPLMRELGAGMAKLSNAAILITVALMVFILLAGPTGFLAGSLVQATGDYLTDFFHRGMVTYAFWDGEVPKYFADWTLNYMAWWLAWAPFVGVFIARISRGRTIREFLGGVLLVPTGFSLCWFGVLGSFGFFQVYNKRYDLDIVTTDINGATFALLDTLPGSTILAAATMAAALLFIITSVVSAAYVLAMFSSGGDETPPTRMKLIWGVILGALGLVMIVTDSVEAVRSIIALSANPFVFIVLLLMVCLLKAIKHEPDTAHAVEPISESTKQTDREVSP